MTNKTELVKFRVKGKVPSYNSSFKINHSIRSTYLSDEAKNFKRKVKMSMPGVRELEETEYLIFDIAVVQDWYCKTNPRVVRKDVQNMDKLYIDAVCSKLGVDDRVVCQSTIRKVQSPTEVYSETTVWVTTQLEVLDV